MQKVSADSLAVVNSGVSHCAHQVCAQQPAIPEPTANLSAHLAPVHLIVAALIFGFPPPALISSPPSETPPFVPLSPVGSHTTLRV
jgi:hypothetical protein